MRGWRAIGPCVASGLLALTPGLPAPARAVMPTIDACALLDAATIRKVLGIPVEKGDRRDSGLESNGAYSSACVWMLSTDPARKSFVILNALRWPRGSDGARSYLQAFRDASDSGVLPSKPSPRPFGDEALWWGDGLAVRRGNVSFGVSVFAPRMSADPDARAGRREERLARIVLARLGSQVSN